MRFWRHLYQEVLVALRSLHYDFEHHRERARMVTVTAGITLLVLGACLGTWLAVMKLAEAPLDTSQPPPVTGTGSAPGTEPADGYPTPEIPPGQVGGGVPIPQVTTAPRPSRRPQVAANPPVATPPAPVPTSAGPSPSGSPDPSPSASSPSPSPSPTTPPPPP